MCLQLVISEAVDFCLNHVVSVIVVVVVVFCCCLLSIALVSTLCCCVLWNNCRFFRLLIYCTVCCCYRSFVEMLCCWCDSETAWVHNNPLNLSSYYKFLCVWMCETSHFLCSSYLTGTFHDARGLNYCLLAVIIFVLFCKCSNSFYLLWVVNKVKVKNGENDIVS